MTLDFGQTSPTPLDYEISNLQFEILSVFHVQLSRISHISRFVESPKFVPIREIRVKTFPPKKSVFIRDYLCEFPECLFEIRASDFLRNLDFGLRISYPRPSAFTCRAEVRRRAGTWLKIKL
jgi:hypothetical protein